MNYEYLYALILLGLAGFIALAAGIKTDNKKILGGFAFIVLIAAFFIILFQQKNYSIVSLNISSFDTYWALIFLVSIMVVIIPSMNDIKKRFDVYYAILLFMALSMVIAAFTYNLIILFVSFEGVSIGTYILTAFNKTKRNLEASLKYFMISTVGTSFNIMGIAFFYLSTKTFNLNAVGIISFNKSLLLALVFITIGFGFKIAIFPMQQWAIDAYDGAPNSVSAFLSTGGKLIAYMILLKFLFLGFIPDYNYVFFFFAILAILTMTYGNLAALMENNLKRILAYSSVAQAGYMILVFALIGYSYYPAVLVSKDIFVRFAIASAMFYAIAYIFMKAGPFIAMSLVKKDKVMIDDIAGLARASRWTALFFAIMLLSLAGVPLTGGFIAKYFLFFSLIIGDLWWLAVIAIINSAISMYYYFRIIIYTYRKEGENNFNMDPGIKYSVIIMGLITLGLGVSFALYTYLAGIALI
ncbi:MAG: NADH-quinone oxidoreductase subunit NuoN [Candidatus Thermoplasmatota archaeon]|jgi:NADH-quinone oxidoreductase subunit N|uniref:NADH-quinone oxidoreductase subunit NuoN n=1 Tax=Ferroplasma sp. TaxID=2591003 RepID=UPI002637462E|nr:NADH-quinone oxidoreductase subunit NuoN [Ferroplasma sp.]MCL4312357.1 NADH-quinone oxidoreductase subunit NuoN [Candidatus Thermoplasmatota archaeon]